MWRDDHLYDLVAVLGYNDDPVVPGKGSAIFLHLAQAGLFRHPWLRGAGYDDALAALEQLTPGDQVQIV